MPFYNEQDEEVSIEPQPQAQEEQPAKDYSFTELFSESFSRETVSGMAGNYIANKIIEPNNNIDPNFDPYSKENISGYEDYADNFIRANNAEMMDHIKMTISKEQRHKHNIEEAGFEGAMASIAAGILDPINLIFPTGGLAVAAKAAPLGKVAAAAIGTAAGGLAYSSAYETVAQATTETRTAEESATNIGFTTILSGTIGAVAGKISSRTGKETVKELNDNLGKLSSTVEGELNNFSSVMNNQSTVGAAQVVEETLETTAVKSAFGLEKTLAFLGPESRLAQSPSLEARKSIMGMAESSLERMGAEKGIRQDIAVESIVRQWESKEKIVSRELLKTFSEYRQGGDGMLSGLKTTVQDITGRTGGKMRFQEFKEEIGRAMIRGDKHENPYIQKIAERYRKDVFDPLKENAIKAGLLPENIDVKTAESYLTRIYDRPKIIAQRLDFMSRISSHLKSSVNNVDDQIRALEAGLKTKMSQSDLNRITELKIMRDLKPEEFDDIANEIIDKIVGTPSGGVQEMFSPLARGPMKERTLLIPDVIIEDYLERDIAKISKRYSKVMATDSELKLKFGSTTLDDQINAVKAEYGELYKKAGNDPKKLKALKKQEDADIRDIAGVRDRLRGMYGMPNDPEALGHRAVRVFKNLNYVRLLGGMVYSSLTDISRPVMRNGLYNSYKAGFVPLVKNWKAIKMTAEETRLAGAAWDLLDSSTSKTIWDIAEQHAGQSKFERGTEWMADKFGSVTLMNHWNTAMKHFSGNVVQHTINKTILGYEKADKKFVARLATLGIGKDNVKGIASQLKKHGDDIDGIFVANTEKWTDEDAVRAYRSALSKEINIEIVTPSQEKPLWMSSAHYGFIGQFKSFSVSSVQRTLLTGLQDKDLATLNGMAMAWGIGAGIYYLKTPEEKLSDDPVVWATNGLDRSGLTGVIFDLNNSVEAITKGGVGLSRVTGEKMGRFTDREAYSSLLGPVPDFVVETGGALGNAVKGDFTQSDLHKIRKLLPMQNLFYIRSLLDAGEKELASELDLPERQTTAKAK